MDQDQRGELPQDLSTLPTEELVRIATEVAQWREEILDAGARLIQELRARGMSWWDITRATGISRTTARRWAARDLTE